MKLLNRLRDLRNEANNEFANTDYNSVEALENNQHQELLGVGTTTIDDILRLNIADTQHHKFHGHQG